MEKFKGTPTPWRVRKIDYIPFVESAKETLGARYGYGQEILADDYHEENWREHDVNLIASAPELLEALQSCLYLIDELGVSEGTAISQAESAINKALGINQQNK